MVGRWDGITGPIITKAWMEESKCLKKMKKKRVYIQGSMGIER